MVRMQDVAEVCGVSLMTVSTAVNRPDQLSLSSRPPGALARRGATSARSWVFPPVSWGEGRGLPRTIRACERTPVGPDQALTRRPLQATAVSQTPRSRVVVASSPGVRGTPSAPISRGCHDAPVTRGVVPLAPAP